MPVRPIWHRIVAILFALILLPMAALAEKATVSTSSLVMRKKASKTSKALQTLTQGTVVYITGTSGQWYKVSYGDYTGYVQKKYVTIGAASSQSSSSSASAVAVDAALLKKIKRVGRPKPCAFGHSGTNVKKVQRILKLYGYYTGRIDGKYGDTTVAAVKALQKAKRITVDGICGRVTIAAMFGETAESAPEEYVTERLDWFANGTSTIPKGAVFTVKDVKTGKTFQCKRWSGANHLDAEPLTKEDTAVMKSIYGKWSWKRRAVLVKYNGHVYAASMNGMPHGTSTIKKNDFDGHFCIHFYGSKTHGTQRVDKTHQNCVNTAMKYSW